METKNDSLIGRNVERVSGKDYTNGRTGVITEVNGDRYRVRWLYTHDGRKVFFGTTEPKNWNGVRTWVNKNGVKFLD